MRFPFPTVLLLVLALIRPAFGQIDFTGLSNPLSPNGWDLTIYPSDKVGQEFVPSLARLDFVKLSIRVPSLGGIRSCRITIHESSMDGPIKAVSEPINLVASYYSRTVRFSFTNEMTLTPGLLHVLEINPIAANPNDILTLDYNPWSSFAPGRLIYEREMYGDSALPSADLLFEAGVTMPSIVSTDIFSVPYVEQQPPVYIAPLATFTNAFLTNLNGAILTVSNTDRNAPSDMFAISGSDALVVIDDKTVGLASGGTNGQPLTVEFWGNATTEDVQAVLRRLVFQNQSETNYFFNRLFCTTFTTSQGEVHFYFEINFTTIYDPPVAHLTVRDEISFMGAPTVLLRHKKENHVYLDASGSTDPDSPINFHWFFGNLPVDDLDYGGVLAVRLAPGSYSVAVQASDFKSQSFAGVSFDVETAATATRKIISAIRGGRHPKLKRMITSLRQAALAFEGRRYQRGVKSLETFKTVFLEMNPGETNSNISHAIEAITTVVSR